MPRPKAQGSLAKNQLQLAIALSTSLEESKNRDLSKLADELPANAIEEGAIPHDIKQMQKEFLERLKPPSAVPAKRQRKTVKTSVPVLYTRSSEERMRIITEKVALVLIKETSVEFYEVSDAACRKLYLNLNKETRLWNMSFSDPSREDKNLYYIDHLSTFISPLDRTGIVKQKNQFPLPGRFLTPQKREPKTSAETPNSQEVNKMSDTQNWSNILHFNAEPSDREAEAQHEFQYAWIAMLNNPTMSDVTIYTDHKGRIAAHKLVLHARCPMILNDLDVSNSLRWDNIDYQDALAFMRFIYSGMVAASLYLNQNSRGVVLLARRYKVVDLLKYVFASDSGSYESDDYRNLLEISEETWNCIGYLNLPNALASVQSDETIEKLEDPIVISSGESTPSDETPARSRSKIGRRKPPVSPTYGSPANLENSKRKMLVEKSPSKLISKKLCMELSDEEEVPSPFKCTLLDSSDCRMLVTSPTSVAREACDDGPNLVEESFWFTSSQLSDSEPETLSQMVRADTLLQPGRASIEHSTSIEIRPVGSPLKTPTSRPAREAQDYKNFLEDSFNFDLNESSAMRGALTPSHRLQDSVTPLRTPLSDVKISSPTTPMPDYTNMTNQQLEAELCRFGLKRSLSRSKGIKMLKHIYGKLHPLVEVVVRGGRELFVPIADKSPIISTIGNGDPQPFRLESRKLGGIPENPDDDDQTEDQPFSQSSSVSSSDGSDVMEETIFAEEDDAAFEDSADLKTIVQVWMASNADMHERVLRYEPIWLESIHAELKDYTKKNLKLSQLMDILDEEGITFRIAQKSSRNVRRKETSPKKKQIVKKNPKNQPTSKRNVPGMQDLE